MPRARLGSSFWVCLMSAAKAAWGMRGERKKKKPAFALLYFDTASNSRSGSSIFLTPRRFGINIERVSLCCARGAARLRASTKQSICWLTRSVDESDGPRSLGMGCGLSVSWIVNSIQFGLLGGLNCWRVWGKGGQEIKQLDEYEANSPSELNYATGASPWKRQPRLDGSGPPLLSLFPLLQWVSEQSHICQWSSR